LPEVGEKPAPRLKKLGRKKTFRKKGDQNGSPIRKKIEGREMGKWFGKKCAGRRGKNFSLP